jgi:hypothetical protein
MAEVGDGNGDPLEGQVLLLAAAKASVYPARLPPLVSSLQAYLEPRLERYRREYECAYEDDRFVVCFVEPGHWEDLGERLGFDDRETSAVERAHVEQLRAIGRETDRLDEFETALEIREAVVIGP